RVYSSTPMSAARSVPTYFAPPAAGPGGSLVSKHRDRPYRGGRQKFWVKVKNRNHPAMDRELSAPQYTRAELSLRSARKLPSQLLRSNCTSSAPRRACSARVSRRRFCRTGKPINIRQRVTRPPNTLIGPFVNQ